MVLSDNVIFGRYPSYNLHSSQLGQSRKTFLHALTFLYLGKIVFCSYIFMRHVPQIAFQEKDKHKMSLLILYF